MQFELVEIDNKIDCIFRIGLNKKANLSCYLNAEKYKTIKSFSFKASLISTNNNVIYLSKFTDIILINNDEEININSDENKKSDDNHDNNNSDNIDYDNITYNNDITDYNNNNNITDNNINYNNTNTNDENNENSGKKL